MPSKIQLDEALWFLYICFQKSDYKTIDFNAVGEVTRLKPPAARMRLTRLRRDIENGTLIGTHGTPFQGAAEKIAKAQMKRRKASLLEDAKDTDDSEEVEKAGFTAKKRKTDSGMADAMEGLNVKQENT